NVAINRLRLVAGIDAGQVDAPGLAVAVFVGAGQHLVERRPGFQRDRVALDDALVDQPRRQADAPGIYAVFEAVALHVDRGGDEQRTRRHALPLVVQLQRHLAQLLVIRLLALLLVGLAL